MTQLDSRTVSELQELADEIEKFPIGYFADDNKRGIFLLGYWKLANKLAAGIKLLSDERLESMISDLNTEPWEPADAFHLHTKLQGVLTVLRNHLAVVASRAASSKPFVDPKLIDELRAAELPKLDLGKLIRMCEELNECYARENYLACALLIRAVMNHVPPVFGFRTFKEVVANCGRSVKGALELLEDDARIVADLHNHATMRSREPLPTLSQIGPFQASFEILLHEIIVRAVNEDPGHQ
jgi:hypothetical protein